MIVLPWYQWALEAALFGCPWNYSVLAQCRDEAKAAISC